MFAVALIVFREVVEAALVLGIVAAATTNIAGRARWLVLGISSGLAGATLVALFADVISGMADGIGQEIFNATVLFLAVLMLGWHNVWMKRHARDMARDMNNFGRSVMEGSRPLYVIAVVVGLAVLREGSEVVLFLFGMASSGVGSSGLLVGGLIGIAAGVTTGWALYIGLLQLSTKRLFTATSWLIILLAAGMAAQGAKFLSQADLLPSLGGSLWDTSTFLSDQSIPGQILHALVGYTARPSGIQLLFYMVTLILMSISLKLPNFLSLKKLAGGGAALFLLSLAFTTLPGDRALASGLKIYSPHVEAGELEFEYQGSRSFDADGTSDNAQTHKFAVGYGVNRFWFTEVYGIWKRDPGDKIHFDATEWENRFQLTEPGEYWLDLGLLVEYEHVRNRANDADEFAIGPLIEKDVGQTTSTLNIIFERQLGANRSDPGVGVTYRFQTKWRLMPEFEPAIQAFGELGPLHNFNSPNRQEHKIGPAILGRLPLGPLQGHIKYDVAYLFGATGATERGTLKTVLEYELPF